MELLIVFVIVCIFLILSFGMYVGLSVNNYKEVAKGITLVALIILLITALVIPQFYKYDEKNRFETYYVQHEGRVKR